MWCTYGASAVGVMVSLTFRETFHQNPKLKPTLLMQDNPDVKMHTQAVGPLYGTRMSSKFAGK
jgi:hypothetical protein